MTPRRPLVLVAGEIAELPFGDPLVGTGALPTGGAAGHYLRKASSADYDAFFTSVLLSDLMGLGGNVATALAISVGSAGSFVTFNGALGTPSSATLTNATGLPISGLVNSTSAALGLGSIELGHASDTTISRASAGVVAIEGANIIVSGGAGGTPSSLTLTNATGLTTAGVLNDAITYPKMQNVSATDRLLGRTSTGAGDVEEIDVGAWTSYTPTITAGTGTFTTVSATGRYKKIGKLVFFHIFITITTNGSAATSVIATLPVASVVTGVATDYRIFVGRETAVVGTILIGQIADNASTCTILTGANTYPGGTGYKLNMDGVYEAV